MKIFMGIEKILVIRPVYTKIVIDILLYIFFYFDCIYFVNIAIFMKC